MKTRLTVSVVLTALVLVTGAAQLQAQALNVASKDITPCMQIANEAAKYACYLRLEAEVLAARVNLPASEASQLATPATQVPAVQVQPTPPAVVAESAVPISAPAVQVQSTQRASLPAATSTAQDDEAVATFGNQTSTATAQIQVTPDGEQVLHDTVVALQERNPNRFLITLESGQVWYQSNSQRFRLTEGMAVRIYLSPLKGSYRLGRDDGKENGFIQVERIK
jgi:hypothetical protein